MELLIVQSRMTRLMIGLVGFHPHTVLHVITMMTEALMRMMELIQTTMILMVEEL